MARGVMEDEQEQIPGLEVLEFTPTPEAPEPASFDSGMTPEFVAPWNRVSSQYPDAAARVKGVRVNPNLRKAKLWAQMAPDGFLEINPDAAGRPDLDRIFAHELVHAKGGDETAAQAIEGQDGIEVLEYTPFVPEPARMQSPAGAERKPTVLPTRKPGEARMVAEPEKGVIGSIGAYISGLFDKDPATGIPILSKKGETLIPFVGPVVEAADAYNLIRAAQRVKAGKGTAADQQVLDDFKEREFAEAQRGQDFTYQVAEIVAHLPAFAAEFAATGGAYTGVKKLVEEALITGATKTAGKMAAKTAAVVAGGAAQTAAMPQRIAAGTAERMAPTAQQVEEELKDWEDDFVPALLKAVPDHFVEVFSERTGGPIEKGFGVLTKLPLPARIKALKTAVLDTWLKRNPAKSVADFLAKVKSATGWNGVLGEMAEEHMAEVMRAAQPYLARPGEAAPPMIRMVTGEQVPGQEVADPRLQAVKDFGQQLMVEAVAFAVPGAAANALKLATAERKPPAAPTVPPGPAGSAQTQPPAGPDLAGGTQIAPGVELVEFTPTPAAAAAPPAPEAAPAPPPTGMEPAPAELPETPVLPPAGTPAEPGTPTPEQMWPAQQIIAEGTKRVEDLTDEELAQQIIDEVEGKTPEPKVGTTEPTTGMRETQAAWRPTSPETTVRLYRSEGGEGGSNAGGRNFTTSREQAERYLKPGARLITLDVDREWLASNQDVDRPDTVVRVNPEMVADARPEPTAQDWAKQTTTPRAPAGLTRQAAVQWARTQAISDGLTGDAYERAVDRYVQQAGHPTRSDYEGRAQFQSPPAAAEKPKREFSSTQVNLGGLVARDVKALADTIPDEDLAADGRETDPHITVKYGIDAAVPVEEVQRILQSAGKGATFTLGATKFFPASESGEADVVYVEVDSPDLHKLNAAVAKGVKTTDTHPEYKPHVTLAYVKTGLGQKYADRVDLKGRRFTVSQVHFSPAEGEMTAIPLTKAQAAPGTSPLGAAKPPAAGVVLRDGNLTATIKADGTTYDIKLGKQIVQEGSFVGMERLKREFDSHIKERTWKATVPKRLGGTMKEPEPEPAVTEPESPQAAIRAEIGDERAKIKADRAERIKRLKDRLGGSTVTSGVDPQIVVEMVGIVRTYIQEGILDFREAVLNFQEDYGEGARGLDRYFEVAWRRLRGEDRKVADALTSEKDEADAGQDAGVRGGGAAETGDTGTPAGGPGVGGPGGVAGEQPGPAPDVEEPARPARGGKRRAPRGTPGAGGPGEVPGPGVEPRGSDGVDEASHVDTADDSSDADVAAANARGEMPRHFTITDTTTLTDGGPSAKAADNLAAIELLKTLERENRPASDDEQAVLARYVGWGSTALAQIVDLRGNVGSQSYQQAARQQLEALLTKKELKLLGESSINAHYSFNDLPRAMWQIVQRLGFKGGFILEPAVGTGHFFGTMPRDILGHLRTRLFAVDKEPIAAAIAKQLYQSAFVQGSPYEEAVIPDGFADLVISNVPFGKVKIFDPAFVSHERSVMSRNIHNYYFAKSLEATRPGGILVLITSRYTMDSQSDAARKYISERANFLGAIRLPREAFKATAGTEVVTDIIVLQKKDPAQEQMAPAQAWNDAIKRDDLGVEYDEDGEEVPIHTNEYFQRHPKMVLGGESRNGKMNGRASYTVEGVNDAVTPTQLTKAVAALPQGVYAEPTTAPRLLATHIDLKTKQGTIVFEKGKLYRYDKGTLVPWELTGEPLRRVKAFLPVRDAYQQTLDVLEANGPDVDLEKAQAALRRTYDAFVTVNGPVNSPVNVKLIDMDPNGPRVLSLEHISRVKPEGAARYVIKVTGLADIFTKRVISPRAKPTSADSVQDALVQSLAWHAGVNMPFIEELTGKPEEQLAEELAGEIFKDPITNAWQTKDEYLSGDVVTKLAQAETRALVDPVFAGNVAALKQIIPATLTPEQFKVPFGSTYVPMEIYAQFITAETAGVGHVDISLSNTEVRTEFYVSNPSGAGNHEFLPPGEDLAEWVADALNGRLPDRYEGTGKDRVKSPELTERYRQSLQQIRESWAAWWPEEPEAAEKLAGIYNAMFNREVYTKPDGSKMYIPNMNPEITLRKQQKDSIWGAIQRGNRGIFHAVGTGKTFILSGIAGEMKRLGLARKPMITVRNPQVKQIAEAFQRMYPTAKVLVPTKEDFQQKNRRRFIAQITSGDWDVVIIGHSQFKKIAASLERVRAFIEEQENMLLADGADQMSMSVEDFDTLVTQFGEDNKAAKRALSQRNGAPQSAKDIARAILRLRARLQRRVDQSQKDMPVVFEELGVDALLVDEAHDFKNLFFSTRHNKIAGLKPSDSDRAMDMYLKVKLINDMSNNRNVVFATGTPVTNAMSEVYTVFRYLAQSVLSRLGMSSFDSWMSNYAVASAELEPNQAGGYTERMRLRLWSNLKELSRLFNRFADIVTTKELVDAGIIKVPKIKGGERTKVVTKAHPQFESFLENLKGRIDAIKAGDPLLDGRDNNLWVTTDAAKAAIDLRLVWPDVPEDPNGRIPTAAREIAKRYKAGAPTKGTQLVFLDIGVPESKLIEPLPKHVLDGPRVILEQEEEEALAADEAEAAEDAEVDEVALLSVASRDLYTDLKQKLIAQGVKPEEIAFIHQARTPIEALQLYEAVNQGRIRVLIATRSKGGIGINVQDKVTAIHHLDVPWRPDQLEQADGRGLRQGNENEEVEILYYVTEKTFDEYRWRLLAIKLKQITEFLRGELDTLDDIDTTQLDLEVMSALASGDMRLLQIMNLEREVSGLRARASNFDRRQSSARRELGAAEARLAKQEQRLAQLTDGAAAADIWESPAALAEAASPRTVGEGAPSRKPLTVLMGDDKYYGPTAAANPKTYDLSDTESRKSLQEALEALLKGTVTREGGRLYSRADIAKAGPFTVVAAPHEFHTTILKADASGVRRPVTEYVYGVNLIIKVGESFIGEAPTWQSDMASAPDYRRSFDAYLKPEKLRALAAREQESIARTQEEIKGNEAIVNKKFAQENELKAKERELYELRVSVGMAQADPVDVYVSELKKLNDQYADRIISAEEFDQRQRDVMKRARDRGVAQKVVDKLDAGASTDDRDDESADSRAESTTTGQTRQPYNEPPTTGTYQGRTIRPAEVPEVITELVRDLGFDVSVVERMRRAETRGQFRGIKGIRLTAELFKPGNERELARVLYEEVGHLTDYLPDHTLTRGNLLGRLRSLRKFLRGTFTDKNGREIKNTTVRAELKALSALWRPWNRKEATEAHRNYRDSSEELYADAVSVLLGDPGLLQKMAPTFWAQFFENLDTKPDFAVSFFALQDLLAGMPEEIAARRSQRTREGFRKGELKASELVRIRMENDRAYARDTGLWLRSMFVDKNAKMNDLVAKAITGGKVIPEDEDPRFFLKERNYVGGRQKAWLEREMQPIHAALGEAGVSLDDFGEYLIANRVVNGDRGKMANPGGWNAGRAGAAQGQLDWLEKTLGPEKWDALTAQATKFYAATKALVREAHEAGLLTDEMYEKAMKNPAYATFQVIEHMDETIAWQFVQMVGTVKEVTNPFGATILKMLSTIRAIERNNMVTASVAFLNTHHPDEIEAAKSHQVMKGGKWVPEFEKPKDKSQGLVVFWEEGKTKGVYVDAYIAESIANESVGFNKRLMRALELLTFSWFFRPMFTTFNPGFMSWNIVRDFLRLWKNTPALSLIEALRQYKKAIPASWHRAFGGQHGTEAWKLINAAEEAKILGTTYNDLTFGARDLNESAVEEAFAAYGIDDFAKRPARHPALEPFLKLADFVKNFGDFIETVPKVAAINYLRGGGRVEDLGAIQRAFIREGAGSPDFRAGGQWTAATNKLLLYSNAMIQGQRADWRMAFHPMREAVPMADGTRRASGFWWKTAATVLVPKLLTWGVMAGMLDWLFGDEPREALEKASTEYDRTNYTNVPLGVTEDGKGVIWRIPSDQASQLIGGVFWKGLMAATKDDVGLKDVMKAVQDIAGYISGTGIPSMSPLIGAGWDTGRFVTGQQIFDDYRQRLLFTDDEYRAYRSGADMGTAARKFLGYELGQLGLEQWAGKDAVRLIVGSRPDKRSTGQIILDLPIVSNVVGRSIKISDYGTIERANQTRDRVAGKESAGRGRERDAVTAAVNDLLDTPNRSGASFTRAAREIVQDLYADKTPKERAAELRDITKKLRMGVERAGADALTDAVMGATSNAQKAEMIVGEFKDQSNAEFQTWLRHARQQGIVTADVRDRVLALRRATASR